MSWKYLEKKILSLLLKEVSVQNFEMPLKMTENTTFSILLSTLYNI